MKAIVIKLLVLILISLSSCSTRKLNKQKSESSASAQSEIMLQSLMNDKLEAKRKILLTDTSDEQYTLIIFPVDSFSFSAQHGFRGKASKIELSGKLRRVIRQTDSLVLRLEKQRDRTYLEQARREKSALSRTWVLERKSWRAMLVFIGLLGIIVVGLSIRRKVVGWFR